jgi:diguanylate cyclase (GGDEF)-like protein/PAS domain S-box-containing protein
MKPEFPLPLAGASEEVIQLIETLHHSGRRLEDLTAGEVDAVTDRHGRTLMLRRSQDKLRDGEAARQTAILNSLRAHIALLDSQGRIVSTNEAWGRYPCTDVPQGAGHMIGLNYLELCDQAPGDDSAEAHQVAEGIRSVLGGGVDSFSLEYACRSPTERYWFQLTVTPLGGNPPTGAVVMHLDISERKRADEELLRFSTAMDATVDAIYLVERSTMRFVHVNAAACRMQSRTREDLLALGPAGVLSTSRAELERIYDALIASGVAAEPLETLRTRKDGSQIWVEIRRHAQRSEGGWMIVTLARDITERKRAEDAILREKNFIAAMLDSLPGLFYVINDEGRFLRWNRNFETVSGYTVDEISRQSPMQYFSAADQGTVAATIAQVFSSGESSVEADFMAKDQTKTPHYFTGKRVQIGQQPCLIGMGIDISERKRGERRVLDSERRFKAIFDQAPIAMALLDRQGYPILSNAPLSQMIGYSDIELSKMTFSEFTYAEDTDKDVDQFNELMEGTISTYSMEKRYVHKNGHLIWANLSVALLRDENGQPQDILGMAEDISERKEADARIIYLNRVHAILSGINTLIVRVHDRDELFAEACRIAVEHGGFRMAMIGIVDPAVDKIFPVASAGKDEELLAAIKGLLSSGDLVSTTMVARAIRGKTAIVSNDSQNDPQVLFGAKYAQAGVRSMAIMPLIVGNKAVGAFALYAGEREFFHNEEMGLLTELAGDIAFAIENIDRQLKLAQLARTRALSNEINIAIIHIHDRDALFKEACRIAVEQGGYKMAWIGIADWVSMKIVPMASVGVESEFLTLAKDGFSLREDAAAGNTMTARALRERTAIVSNDIRIDPRIYFAKKRVEKGILSIAVLPLMVSNEAFGAFNLYAGEAGFFDDEEMSLLTQMAGNIAFALENIDRQQKLAQLSRIRAVVGEINAAIVRIHRRDELLKEICRIAIEAGQFRLVWIGITNRDTQNIDVAAWAGDDQGHLSMVRSVVDAMKKAGPGLASKAIQTRKYTLCNNIETDTEVLAYPKEAFARGFRAAIALPLFVSDEAIGALHLYAGNANFFDGQEIALLTELAGNISFALEHIGTSEQLKYLAYYDELTGLANATFFRERISQLIATSDRNAKQFAIVMFNVERFKTINDTLGRKAGDELLKQIAERTKNAIVDVNWIARIGGDHFAKVFPEVTGAEEAARHVMRKYKEIFDSPFDVGGTELRVTARMGIAMFPNDGADADTLLHQAESALKTAKASGERYMFYTPQMAARVAETLILENKLRRALENEEFVLHYQPKVSLETGGITGVEALIRWNDPVTGLVPPAHFIPLLEETGMIREVGSWALMRAVLDHAHWLDLGLQAPRIAVNVSPIQLRQRDFVEMVKQAIAFGASPPGIDLEITESLIMEDVDSNIVKLNAVRDMGLTIYIDDFGTGYSSLGYLAKLPVQSLKIDRSFVITMLQDTNTMALVSTIISLAHSLKLKVVAEGVDKEEQAQVLRALRCEEMQGYLFSKPVSRETFEERFLIPNDVAKQTGETILQTDAVAHPVSLG